MPRKRKKPVTLATAARPGIEVVAAVVRDPYDGRPLTVAKNARVHPLDHMLARGRLTEAQKAAGDRFLEIWDRAEIGGARAIDYGRVKVDVSFEYRGLDPAVMGATDKLAGICGALGRRAYMLLVHVIGMRMSIFDLARRADGTVDQALGRHLSASVKDALDDLIDHFGVAKGAPRRSPPFERKIKPHVGKIPLDDAEA